MTLRIALAAAAALLLVACGEGASAPEPPPSPPFYEIASADGEVEGWLLGTIHALPGEVEWRTEPIDDAIAQADVLVMEVAGLDDADGHARLFARLSAAPEQPPLASKVAPPLRGQLADMLVAGDLDPASFARTDTWAAAIMLAQVVRHGDSANGVERKLAAAFAGRPVSELEGVERQLALFDALPEQDQRDMLAAVVAGFPEAQADPGRLARMWRSGDLAAIEAETTSGMLADPELYEALLEGRNRAWTVQLVPMLQAQPRPLIAVGAAHLVGPDGLAAMLEARGYTLTRVR